MTELDHLQETPSRTAGPYVHIGLIPHQAGFDIFERPFGNVLAGPSRARLSRDASFMSILSFAEPVQQPDLTTTVTHREVVKNVINLFVKELEC